MRVYAANAPAVMPSASGPRRTGGVGFTVAADKSSRAPSGAGAVRNLGGIEALLALQSVEDPTERRRRAVGRGRTALDALDELKVALLAGDLGPSAVARLRAAAAALEKDAGDPGLDDVLAQIDLRAQVELAKIAVAQAGPKSA